MSNLITALASGGGAVAIIGAIAKYLPQSKTEAVQRADKLTADALARLEKDNADVRARMQAMEDQHDADERRADEQRRRIGELEDEVRHLRRELERAAYLAAERDRPPGLRARATDLPPRGS